MSDESVSDDTLVLTAPTADLAAASRMRVDDLTANRPENDTSWLDLLVRVGVARDERWKPSLRAPKLDTDLKIAQAMRYLIDYDQEYLVVIALAEDRTLLGFHEVGVGPASNVAFAMRDVLKVPLLLNAPRFAVVHNHPSGNPAPSREDREAVTGWVRVGRCLSLTLEAGLVVARNGYANIAQHEVRRWP